MPDIHEVSRLQRFHRLNRAQSRQKMVSMTEVRSAMHDSSEWVLRTAITAQILGSDQPKFVITVCGKKLRIYNYNEEGRLFYLRQIEFAESIIALSKFTPPHVGVDWLLIGHTSCVKVIGFADIDTDFELANLPLFHGHRIAGTDKEYHLAPELLFEDPKHGLITLYTEEGCFFSFKISRSRGKTLEDHLKEIHNSKGSAKLKLFNSPAVLTWSNIYRSKINKLYIPKLLHFTVKTNKEGLSYYSIAVDIERNLSLTKLSPNLKSGSKYPGVISSIDTPINLNCIVGIVDVQRLILFTYNGFILSHKYLNTELTDAAKKRRLKFIYELCEIQETTFVSFTFKKRWRTTAVVPLSDGPLSNGSDLSSILVVDMSGKAQLVTVSVTFNSLDQLLKKTKITEIKGKLPPQTSRIVKITDALFVGITDRSSYLFSLKDDTVEIQNTFQERELVERRINVSSFFPSHRSWKIDDSVVIRDAYGFQTYRFDKTGMVRTKMIPQLESISKEEVIYDLKKVQDELVIMTDKGTIGTEEIRGSLTAASILDNGDILYYISYNIFLGENEYYFPERVSVLKKFEISGSGLILAGTAEGIVIKIDTSTEAQTIVLENTDIVNDIFVKEAGGTHHYIISDTSGCLHIVNAVGEAEKIQLGKSPITLLDYDENTLLAYNETHIVRVSFEKGQAKKSIYTDFQSPVKLLIKVPETARIVVFDGTRFQVFDRSFLSFYGFDKLKRKSSQLQK